MFGAEPWSETLRKHLEQRLHLTAYDSYGLSEIMGPALRPSAGGAAACM